MNRAYLHPKYWPTWMGLALLWMTSQLPIKWQLGLGKVLGLVAYHTLKRRRYIAEVNIGIAFPELSEKEQQALVKANIVSTVQGFFETGFGWWASEKRIEACSRLEGNEYFDQANASGQRILVIGMHVTSLDLSGRVMASKTDIDVTYKPQKNALFNHVMTSNRRKSFKHTFELSEMRSMMKAMKKDGRIVWYAPDQDFGRSGSVFAPFFHRDAATITTTSKILKITKAKPLLYSHFRTIENGKIMYVGKIHDPFEGEFGIDDYTDAKIINAGIADAIREYPEQYLWVHERYRSRPKPGMPNIYKKYKKKKKKKKKSS